MKMPAVSADAVDAQKLARYTAPATWKFAIYDRPLQMVWAPLATVRPI
jgi:hypothetical protein